MHSIKNNQTPGPDGISGEIPKRENMNILLQLFNTIHFRVIIKREIFIKVQCHLG